MAPEIRSSRCRKIQCHYLFPMVWINNSTFTWIQRLPGFTFGHVNLGLYLELCTHDRRYRKSLKTGLCLFYCVRCLLKKLILNRSLMNNFQTMVVGVTIFWYFVLVSLKFIFIPFQSLILMFSTSSYLAGKCFMIIYIFFSSFLETPPWKQKRSISPKW